MFVQCRLREIMAERRIGVQELHELSGVSRASISALRTEGWKGVGRDTIGGLCGALKIDPGELFTLYERDIWYSVRTHRDVTVHFGSNSIPATDGGPARADEAVPFDRQYVAARDFSAFRRIMDHLAGIGRDIRVRLHEHAMGRDSGYGANGADAVERVFEGGNHVVIGSPIANPWAEPIVARMYGATPYTPSERNRFPYGFVWDSRRTVQSSFGWQGVGAEFGIASTETGRLVARRSLVMRSGAGEDCALIAVCRIFQPPRQRRFGRDDARTILCLLGHGGLGTEGAAMLATDPAYSSRLFPAKTGEPGMWVVSTQYLRPIITDNRDNRHVTGVSLVDPE